MALAASEGALISFLRTQYNEPLDKVSNLDTPLSDLLYFIPGAGQAIQRTNAVEITAALVQYLNKLGVTVEASSTAGAAFDALMSAFFDNAENTSIRQLAAIIDDHYKFFDE